MRLACVMLIVLTACASCVHRSPGTLYEPSTAPLTADESRLRDELRRDVEALAVDIGPRNGASSLPSLLAAERWIIAQLTAAGVTTRRDEIDMATGTVANVEATFPGTTHPDEIIVLGAHYDTVHGSPGGNDNASGVALLLATARRLRDAPTARTVRIVFFVNEEDPFSGGILMGSNVYAKRCRAAGDDIVAMLCVDGVGYFTSEPGSQNYPIFVAGQLPSTADFIAFGGNHENEALVDRVVEIFQSESRFPSIGLTAGTKTVSRSDHASFWWAGYPAIFVTDTSEARDPHYHSPTDVAKNLNYDEMARLAHGFVRTVRALAAAETALPQIAAVQ